MWSTPDMSTPHTVAYLGRTLETVVLAVAVLYRLAGDRARSTALGSLNVAIAANVLWVGYQYATGKQSTLIDSGVGDLIESHDPKLIGEGSAFGTGFFFALVAALGCAELLTRAVTRWAGPLLMAIGLIGAYISQSRASVGAAAVCIVAAVVLPDVHRKSRVVAVGALALAAPVAVPKLPQKGRLSKAGTQAGFGARTTPSAMFNRQAPGRPPLGSTCSAAHRGGGGRESRAGFTDRRYVDAYRDASFTGLFGGASLDSLPDRPPKLAWITRRAEEVHRHSDPVV